MLKELELNDGLVINTDEILTISRQNAPTPPFIIVNGTVISEAKYKYLPEWLIMHNMVSEIDRDEIWSRTADELERSVAEYSHWKKCMEGVAPDDPEHKYVVAMKNGDIYYITKKEYDLLNDMHPYSLMDEIHDKFKEVSGLKYIPVDKELHITNSETIHTDDNSIQLKLTFELKDKCDE